MANKIADKLYKKMFNVDDDDKNLKLHLVPKKINVVIFPIHHYKIYNKIINIKLIFYLQQMIIIINMFLLLLM